MVVEFRDLGREWAPARRQVDAAVGRVLDSSVFILGSEVQSFEDEWASHCGTDRAVGVGSGLAALELALRALGIGRGDEVIVPAYTFVATWLAVTAVGAIPVGADVDPTTANIDPAAAAAVLSPRTAAIMPVHLFGLPAPMEQIMLLAKTHGLAVVEDAAQAHGASLNGRHVGSLGDVAAFSFYPTKNLAAAGDAGAATTDDRDVAALIRQYRNYGGTGEGVLGRYGTNSRLDELQAAILRARLEHLDDRIKRRREIARHYTESLSDVLAVPEVPFGCEPAWHIYSVRTDSRDSLADHLERRGIETRAYYKTLPADQPVLQGLPRTSTPKAYELASTSLALPCHPAMGADVDHVVEAVRTFFGSM